MRDLFNSQNLNIEKITQIANAEVVPNGADFSRKIIEALRDRAPLSFPKTVYGCRAINHYLGETALAAGSIEASVYFIPQIGGLLNEYGELAEPNSNIEPYQFAAHRTGINEKLLHALTKHERVILPTASDVVSRLLTGLRKEADNIHDWIAFEPSGHKRIPPSYPEW